MFHLLENEILAKKITNALDFSPRSAHVGANENVPSAMCVFNGSLWTETIFKHYDDHGNGKVTFCLEVIVYMDYFSDVN